jgi:hypothetical protein
MFTISKTHLSSGAIKLCPAFEIFKWTLIVVPLNGGNSQSWLLEAGGRDHPHQNTIT